MMWLEQDKTKKGKRGEGEERRNNKLLIKENSRG